MTTTNVIPLNHRDRAVLRAVAAGRCQISGGAAASLTIDGLRCCDQMVGVRLTTAGLIAAAALQACSGPCAATLTASGRALLEAA